MINHGQKIDCRAFVSEKYFRHFSEKTFSAELISRQSFLSCETKFLAHLWKEWVFTAAKLVMNLGLPFLERHRLLPYLGGGVRVRGKPGIGLKVFQG